MHLLITLTLIKRVRSTIILHYNMKIAFIGIVKNGADYIQRNIEIIRYLHQDIYIVENNSTDGTKEILQRLKNKGTIKNVTTLDLDQRDAISFCDYNINALCTKRVRRLAYIRQQGLDSVLQSGIKYDYVCMLDLDFIHVDIHEFVDVVRYMESNKQVDGMFGMSIIDGIHLPYDYGAIKPIYKILPVYFKIKRYITVDSAFSGFGLYRMTSIQETGARYDYENIIYIEHEHFNSYFNNLIVDTHFRPIYSISQSNISRTRCILISVFCILLYTYHRLRRARASYS